MDPNRCAATCGGIGEIRRNEGDGDGKSLRLLSSHSSHPHDTLDQIWSTQPVLLRSQEKGSEAA